MTTHSTSQSEHWRTDEGQRECVERRAAAEGVEPLELLIRWASEHGEKADAAEGHGRELRKSERKCLADAHRWYGQVPVEDVEIGQTIWIYAIASNEGWDWISRKVVGKGTRDDDTYGEIPVLLLRDGEREYDWTPKPNLLVDVRRPPR